MKGGGPHRAIQGALAAAKAMRKARAMIRRLGPRAVLSVGGYAAGPAALAGVSERVPLAILEPNSTLGFANRLLAPFAKRAYVAWQATGRHFQRDKVRLYGVPLRHGFDPRPHADGGADEAVAVEAAEAPPKRLLVLGGSQGAQALNDVLPGAVARAASRVRVSVVHQTGRDRDAVVRAAYAKLGLPDVTVAAFLDDVAAQMGAADLIVARAGAVTVAEIASIGRAAIFVPFPHAADDHQAKNALALAGLGGAVCLRQEVADETRLASEIAELLADDPRRVRMADAAREHGRPHAAEEIARDLLDLAGISASRPSPKKSTEPEAGKTNGSSKFKIEIAPDRKGTS
jgi:UDP-N-acetylglucosamine--N-acetylmuramyl-(pentapeptide) pyrophosphoryl-undecaprenol N-acetylglucosamine transferase